jgi:hypothetical protein
VGHPASSVFQIVKADEQEKHEQNHWQKDDEPEVLLHQVADSAVVELIVGKHQHGAS